MSRKFQSDVTETIAILAQRFPAAIHVFEQRRRPLAIGVFGVIRTELPELDQKALRAALRTYCSNTAYLRACTETGAVRINLAGDPVGPVSAEDAAGAVAKIAAVTAKRATRKAAKIAESAFVHWNRE